MASSAAGASAQGISALSARVAPHEAAAPPLYWPPLLFRQICILVMIAGMLGPRHPSAAGAAALLSTALAFSAAGGATAAPARRTAAVLALCLSFALGWGLALRADSALPVKETPPAWVAAAVSPDGPERIPGGAPDPMFSKGVSVQGRVRETDRMPGNRLRLILDDVRRTGEASPSLPGSLALTWRDPPPDLDRIGPGQTLTATLRLRELRSLANPGLWETENYWRGRGVLYRAWPQGAPSGAAWSAPSRPDQSFGAGTELRTKKKPVYAISGEASRLWSCREKLRLAVLGLLFPAGAEQNPPQAAAVIPALLFGDRSFCDPATLDLVARATLAHSLALSGMHLGFAAALGYGAATLLGFVFPRLFLRLPRQKAGLLLAAPLCLTYLWLGGSPPSLVRAALMLLFWGWLLWKKRPKVLTDGLIWAVALILVCDPPALYDLRLQLSAVSVAGIALAAPLLGRLYRLSRAESGAVARNAAPAQPETGGSDHLKHVLCAALACLGVSLAAQTAIFPLLIDAFTGTGLWLPLNLLWLPVLGSVVMPLAFAGLFCSALVLAGLPLAGFAAKGLFLLAELPCAALLGLLGRMDAAGILAAPVALRPPWPAWIGFWLLLLLLPPLVMRRAFSRHSACMAVLGMLLLVGPSLGGGLRGLTPGVGLQLIDVGQGQSLLISWQGIDGAEGRVLVDGGGFAPSASSAASFDLGRQVVAPLLTANRAPELTWVVSTHGDADHLQGLLFPLASFTIAGFAQSVAEADPEQGTRSATVERKERILQARGIVPALWRAGDSIVLAPGLRLDVLHPRVGAAASSNNSSLALRLVWRDRGLALICSDLEKSGLRRMLADAAKQDLSSDVLILPHHGSAGSLEPALYDAARPKLVLASCGYANQWRFPAAAVRRALAERGIPLETTADRGQISVEWRQEQKPAVRFARQ